MTKKMKRRGGKPEGPSRAQVRASPLHGSTEAEPEAIAPPGVRRQADPDMNAAHVPIVGIGASAGGLAAFEAFFSAMPADAEPGMAFVLVQHLAPDHKSILSDLVKRYTTMRVFEVEDGMAVRPNCAYIIPPNRDMAFVNGTLQLLEPVATRGLRLPIDFFFRSLAQDQHERAIGIVLSGTGGDGTLGARAIKGEGGLVMAQTPESTEYDGMPRSVIATGLVDYVMPPAEMPAQLMAFASHAFGNALSASPLTKSEDQVKKIFVLLRAQTGHDFSLYKQTTISRRIERRMAIHQIEGLADYVRYLRETPAEVEALFGDFLIGVTNFFRDTEAFAAFEDHAVTALREGLRRGCVLLQIVFQQGILPERPVVPVRSRPGRSPAPLRWQARERRAPRVGGRLFHGRRGLLHRHAVPGAHARAETEFSGAVLRH
jgi:two-component system CheB/CheR fusion protein